MEVSKGIYSVGILNPNMRIFDIVMRTEYGTSYNSFIVKGEKIALIDGCHEKFVDQYITNIEKVTPLNKIDYLIVNHCEPDHTGALRQLLKRIPNIQIYCTPASKLFLTEITNMALNIHVVKDHELLDLGGKTLEFIIAPFLHWPDSMFTYAKENKTVFTCDFLGSHYCEPTMIDTKIPYPEKYKSSLKLYYDVIFSPFKSYVNSGLDKLGQLDCETVCTSHGPILTKQGLYKMVLNHYREWSQIQPTQKSIPIVFASSYGYTSMVAQAICDGIKSIDPDIQCNLYDANNFSQDELLQIINSSTAFCIGSPTLNKNAVPSISNLLMNIDTINTKDKHVLIFGSFGWSGEAQNILLQTAMVLQLKPYEKGIHIRFAPSTEQLEQTKKTAQAFVQAVLSNI